ncbi:MobV family relaxase [Cupriavidus sp. D39]|uniref:MobV family relaxase n=1 Tax=Cupriavidus sp. D39 TaxID=2997877 RepID=UPI002271FE86|nr:MobV family relaxase [Cupriavidus sp. D39]MCY0853216.1 plasmid recombination protein [Cupriavidus sp. D39]
MRYQILRARKLSSYGNLNASGQHTWRERATPNADPSRTPKNRDLRPVSSASALVAAVRSRLALADQKAQKPVICIEYLITASPEAFARHSKGKGLADDSAYFGDALAYLEQVHGPQNIVAANLQLDERSPHLVVYAVPLVETPARVRKRSVIVGTEPNGEKRREIREYAEAAAVRLSAAHFLDGRPKLAKLQTDFHLAVAKKHGLERGVVGSKAKHARVKRFYAVVDGETPRIPKQSLPQTGILEGKSAYGARVQKQTEKVFASVIEPLFVRSQALDTARMRASLSEQRHKEAERKRREAERLAELARVAEMDSRRFAEALAKEKEGLLMDLSPDEAQKVLDAYREFKRRRNADQADAKEGSGEPRRPSPRSF